VAVGIACWLSPFMNIFEGGKPSLLGAFIAGIIYMGAAFCFWWQSIRFAIRADETGVKQTNGFCRQTVFWSDVAYYYMENKATSVRTGPHSEPLLFNSKGKVVFRGYGYNLNLSQKIIQQRNELWQFIETQLHGKKIDAPSINLDPSTLAWKSIEVDWTNKSWLWKIGRAIALFLYAILWFCFFAIPLYYVTSHNLKLPEYYTIYFMLPWICPALPHLIWHHFKKREIEKEIEAQNVLQHISR
jgi:hypothetical protein